MLMTFSRRIPTVKKDYQWYNFNSSDLLQLLSSSLITSESEMHNVLHQQDPVGLLVYTV